MLMDRWHRLTCTTVEHGLMQTASLLQMLLGMSRARHMMCDAAF